MRGLERLWCEVLCSVNELIFIIYRTQGEVQYLEELRSLRTKRFGGVELNDVC